MTLKRSLEYFRAHQEEFVKEHYKQFVLIHDETIEGFFKDELSAYISGKNKYPAGGFLIRSCIKREEESNVVLHSRVAI